MNTTPQIRPLPTGAVAVPYLDQLFGEWAMEPRLFNAVVEQAFSINIANHLATIDPQSAFTDPKTDYRYAMVHEGVAVVPISGVMTKHETSMSRYGFGGTSTVLARRDVRRAAADKDVRQILIHIESGGGMARGTKEFADEIRSASKTKPVIAYVEDISASAAYWAASGAQRIIANQPAKVGSIGTYAVIHDSSLQSEKRGVITHVIRAGEFKGAGQPGTVITPEQLAEFQREINSTNDLFVGSVAAHRKMNLDDVRELADGRIHTATDARLLGLIDDVATFDDVLNDLTRRSRPRPTAPRANAFSGTAKERHAKMIHALQNGAGMNWTDAFSHIKQHEPEVHAAMMAERTGTTLQPTEPTKPYSEWSEAEKHESVQETFGSFKPITPVIAEPPASEQWESEIQSHIRQGKSPTEARRLANRQNPGLRERYLSEFASR